MSGGSIISCRGVMHVWFKLTHLARCAVAEEKNADGSCHQTAAKKDCTETYPYPYGRATERRLPLHAGKARQGKARQGKARQGKERQGKARQPKGRPLVRYGRKVARPTTGGGEFCTARCAAQARLSQPPLRLCATAERSLHLPIISPCGRKVCPYRMRDWFNTHLGAFLSTEGARKKERVVS